MPKTETRTSFCVQIWEVSRWVDYGEHLVESHMWEQYDRCVLHHPTKRWRPVRKEALITILEEING